MPCDYKSFCITFDFIKNFQPGAYAGNSDLRFYWVTQRALSQPETYLCTCPQRDGDTCWCSYSKLKIIFMLNGVITMYLRTCNSTLLNLIL